MTNNGTTETERNTLHLKIMNTIVPRVLFVLATSLPLSPIFVMLTIYGIKKLERVLGDLSAITVWSNPGEGQSTLGCVDEARRLRTTRGATL